MRKYFILTSALCLLLSCSPSQQKPAEQVAIETPAQGIEALKSGNTRFVTGKSNGQNRDMARLASLADGQAPYAAVIACSDSRVPVELLFDQGFGDLFVIRTAGNTVVDEMIQGSVDYAINHLGVKVVLVLGHTSCGAITGVVAEPDTTHAVITDDGDVPAMLDQIGCQISEYKGKGECCLNEAIQANIDVQIESMNKLDHISKKVNDGTLAIVSAVYNVSNGEVVFK